MAGEGSSRDERFRLILPRTGDFNPPSQSRSPPRTKRTAVLAACSSCRRRKAKCDGDRPKCSGCLVGGRDCVYETNPSETRGTALKRKYGQLEHRLDSLRESQETLEQLVHAIKSRPKADATAIFNRIREGVDVGSILQHIRTGDLLLQLQMKPETKYRYDFPYRTNMPSHLLRDDNPYLGSLIYEVAFQPPDTKGKRRIVHDVPELTIPRPMTEIFQPQYLTPFPVASVVDGRLNSIIPSQWTEVSSDDELMRILLQSYFHHEYDWFTVFHKDHFLDDMKSGSKRYCSSLLVNTILAFACGCNRAIPDRYQHWNPHTLGYKFFAEAKRLLELERGLSSSLTSLQACISISVLFNLYSLDKIGMTYNVQAVAMARELKLFDRSRRFKSKRKQMSYDFTAWCFFTWTTIQSYHYLMPPLIKDRPPCALPDPEENPEFYGETLIRYPGSDAVLPMHFGYLMKAKGELAMHLYRISSQLFENVQTKDAGDEDQDQDQDQDQDEDENPSATQIATYITALLKWKNGLPDNLKPEDIVYPGQLKLHLLIQNVLINLCESLIAREETSLFPAPLNDPKALLATTKMHFETLIRLYYLRHGFEACDSYMNQFLVVMAFSSQNELNSLRINDESTNTKDKEYLEDTRGSLILAAKGIYEQSKCFYLGRSLLHVIHGGMTTEDAQLFYTTANIEKESIGVERQRVLNVQAQYPIGVKDLVDFPKKQRLSDMVKKFAELGVGEETDGEGLGTLDSSSSGSSI